MKPKVLLLSFLFVLPLTAAHAEVQAPNSFIIELQNHLQLSLPSEAPDRDTQLNYDSLSPDEQIRFLQRRQTFLTSVARTLSGPRLVGVWAFGLGSKLSPIVSPKTWFAPILKFSKWLIAPAEYLASPSSKIQKELETAAPVEEIKFTSAPKSSRGLTRRGFETIRAILGAVDKRLWGDCQRLAKTTHYATSFLAGPSLGVAVGNIGFYRMIGLEFEFGADFANKRTYAEVHPISQKLAKAIYVIESQFVIGSHLKFTQREQGNLVGDGREQGLFVPPIFSYRRSEASLGFGILSGVNLIDTAALGLMFFNHHYALWGTVWTAAKILTLTSMYWTNMRTYAKISVPWRLWQTPELIEAQTLIAQDTEENLAHLQAVEEKLERPSCESAFKAEN